MSDNNEAQFIKDVDREIDDFVTLDLMDKIDTIAKRHKIPEERVAELLSRVEDTLNVLDAWSEYVE